jgi:hypothetical protein
LHYCTLHSTLPYPILFCLVLSCPTLSYSALFCPVLFCLVLSCPTLSYSALFCPVLPYPILPCSVLSNPLQFRLVRLCSVLLYLTLPYPIYCLIFQVTLKDTRYTAILYRIQSCRHGHAIINIYLCLCRDKDNKKLTTRIALHFGMSSNGGAS